MGNSSTRVNLSIPLEIAIQIEKDCEKRGINKTQFIKESINEKLKRDASETDYLQDKVKTISSEISELRKIMGLILDKIK
jgi:hypothetical protein